MICRFFARVFTFTGLLFTFGSMLMLGWALRCVRRGRAVQEKA